MDINHLHEQYWFHDGAIKSFRLDIQNSTAAIELLVKRHIGGKLAGQIQEKDLLSCTLRLVFEDLVEVSLFDKFPTQGYYLNFSSYGKMGEEVGVSLSVHDNSNHVYEKDNWVIKARRITWREV